MELYFDYLYLIFGKIGFNFFLHLILDTLTFLLLIFFYQQCLFLVEIVVEIAPLAVSFAKTVRFGSTTAVKNFKKKQFNEISKKKNNACDYICSKCTKTPEGTYDFDKSLKRLGNYAKNGNLEAGASLEMVLLRSENLTPITNRKDLVYSANLIADRVSEQILASLNMSVARRTPIYVSGDGNCLYNAISVGICGNESLSAEYA